MAVSIDWLVSSVVDGSQSTGHSGGQDWSVSHGVVSHVRVGVEADVSAGSGQDSGKTEEGLEMDEMLLELGETLDVSYLHVDVIVLSR